MNEELSIIIKAVTDNAKKNIQGVRKELGGMGKEGGKASLSLGKAFKAVGVAAAAVVGTVIALTTALVALANNTKQFRQEQAKLNTAFLAAGSTTGQAAESYKNLYRFLGDSGKATEAAAHLAKLTTNEQKLAEWTTALQGVYATFGDSLPIEGLTEAANETAKVGQVTGPLADALNWAGVNEDKFNAQLAATNSEAEREALIRNTLNGLYSDAAQLYEKNNAELIAANEAQARLDATTASLGKTTQPLQTALTNLSNSLLVALTPAITAVTKALTWLINALTSAVQWVINFFGIVSGGKVDLASGFTGAATGASNLGDNLDSAEKAAQKLKRTTAGFDELNIMSDPNSGGSGGGAATGGGSGISGGFALDTSALDSTVDKTGQKFTEFVNLLKKKADELKKVFAPTIKEITGVFQKMGKAWDNAKPNFTKGLGEFAEGFKSVYSYLLETFIPDVVNTWSTNFLPMFGDISAYTIEELGLTFEWLGEKFNQVSNDIIIPALESIKTVYTDIMAGIGAAWAEHGEPFISKIKKFTEGIRTTLSNLYDQFLKPLWDSLKDGIDELWGEYLKPIWDKLTMLVAKVVNILLDLWNNVLKPIVDWVLEYLYPRLLDVFNWIKDIFLSVAKSISGVISGILTYFDGLIDFISGVFTGDWKKAWEGVKKIFSGLWESLVSVIKLPLNLIIDGINALLRGLATAVNTVVKAINKLSFTVPDWVPGIGGKKFGFNLKEVTAASIPKLAKGGIVDSATLALIGERGKEAVLPLEGNNAAWMDKLVDKLAARTSAPTKIVLMLNEKELGWASINSINSITQQTGQLNLRLV